MINRFNSSLKNGALTLGALLLIAGLGAAGCDSPDLGHQATQAELDKAKEQAKSSVESRSDLSPEQKAGLQKYYGGNAPGGPPRGAPAQPPAGK